MNPETISNSQLFTRRTLVSRLLKWALLAPINGSIINSALSSIADARPKWNCQERDFEGARDMALNWPSLVIELEVKQFPYDLNYLNPYFFDIPILRIFVHEMFHFWQVLSHGFLANIALQQWDDVLAFEKSGNPPRKSALEETYEKKRILVGGTAELFSPQELLECLARFWDVQVVSPAKIDSWEAKLGEARIGLHKRGFRAERTLAEGSDVPFTQGNDFDAVMRKDRNVSGPYELLLDLYGFLRSTISLDTHLGHTAPH